MIPNVGEIIADSEEEDEMSIPDSGLRTDTTKTVDVMTSATYAVKNSDSISSFTPQQQQLSQPPIAILVSASEMQSTIQTESSTTKARTAKKKTGAGLTADPIQSTSTTPNGSSRPKPRQPRRKANRNTAMEGGIQQTAAAGPSSISNPDSSPSRKPPLMIDDIESFSLGVAERAKLQSRTRTSKSTASAPPPDDVIILTSDDDEILLQPAPKVKPKPRKAPQKRAAEPRDLFDPLPDSTPMFLLPEPTSDPNVSFGSQLPPSDPPQSSGTEPLKSTPIDLLALHNEREPSPPPSPMPAMRKGKRTAMSMAGLDDEDDDIRLRSPHITADNDDELMPPPPPPFFAPSSSSSAVPPSDVTTSTNNSNKRKRKPKDDGGSAAIEGSPPKKARGRKKKADDDEEDWNGDDEPPKKAKAKPKPKTKRQTKKTMVVEVPRAKHSPVKAIASGNAMDPPVNDESPTTGGKEERVIPPEPPKNNVTAIESELSSLESDLDNAKASSSNATKKASPKRRTATRAPREDNMDSESRPKGKGKGKRRAVVDSEEEGDDTEAIILPPSPKRSKVKGKQIAQAPTGPEPDKDEEENHELGVSHKLDETPQTPAYRRATAPPSSATSNSSRLYSIPKKSTPMSELIRKVNSIPGSPFASTRPTHSPYMKASRSLLRKIAPLHPHRRTPPPPPPRLPPPKKTKKQLELEEKWEMELEDSVEGWYCLTEEERAALRRAKRMAEMGFDD
ncbi:unnamed protein product [Somion occarium]|uniref:Uncharacterized protein n=2 Tax=Somion occarium TaxID=3059160 RepID=A0ABP1E8U9_9APHY